MKDIHKIEHMVQEILEQDINARNSDDYLYYSVCQRVNAALLEHRLGDVLLGFNGLNLPRYASVSRARRKIQAKFPNLKATEEVKEMRLEREIIFEDYAKEKF